MKPKKLQIAIPEPCHEDWNKMTPKDQGAFCGSCSKIVVDFTKMTDRELITYFEKMKDQKTCGRFTPYQIDRTMVANTPIPPFYLRMKNLLYGFLFSLTLPSFLKAETKMSLNNSSYLIDQDTVFLSEIKGKVVNENGEAIPFAKIKLIVNGNVLSFSNKSDFNGEFLLNLSQFKELHSLQIQISHTDYETQVVDIDANKNYLVSMLQINEGLMGEVVEITPIEHIKGDVALVQVEDTIDVGLFPNIIKGRVINEFGEELPFSTVQINGTDLGIATDVDGYFELELTQELRVQKNIVLEIKYVGFETNLLTINAGNNLQDLEVVLIQQHMIMGMMMVGQPAIKLTDLKELKEGPKWKQEGFSSRKEYQEFKKTNRD